jgi:hypothetical protein
MRNRLRATLFLLPLLLPAGPVLKAAEPEVQALETAYPRDVLPLLVRYCHECHSAETAEADVDLTAFRSWNDVKRQPRTWQKVGEMLDSSQMPPKDARQPAPAERTKLQQWVRGFLNLEARARAI